MKNTESKQKYVLGIAPSARGLGFAVMAEENILVDWGVKQVKGGKKNERSLSDTANLIDHYKPDVIAIEETEGSRRGERIQELLQEIVAMAEGENIKVKRFSRRQMHVEILQNKHGTRHALAEHLAVLFPEELSFRLPQRRRMWTSEPYQMDIFQAVALARCSIAAERVGKVAEFQSKNMA